VTCPQCGGMGRCSTVAVRNVARCAPLTPTTTTVTPISTNAPVTAPLDADRRASVHQQSTPSPTSLPTDLSPLRHAKQWRGLWLVVAVGSLSQPMPASTSARMPRNRIVVAMLGLFLGVVGAQYFYMAHSLGD
jgi:hypothetical protein